MSDSWLDCSPDGLTGSPSLPSLVGLPFVCLLSSFGSLVLSPLCLAFCLPLVSLLSLFCLPHVLLYLLSVSILFLFLSTCCLPVQCPLTSKCVALRLQVCFTCSGVDSTNYPHCAGELAYMPQQSVLLIIILPAEQVRISLPGVLHAQEWWWVGAGGRGREGEIMISGMSSSDRWPADSWCHFFLTPAPKCVTVAKLGLQGYMACRFLEPPLFWTPAPKCVSVNKRRHKKDKEGGHKEGRRKKERHKKGGHKKGEDTTRRGTQKERENKRGGKTKGEGHKMDTKEEEGRNKKEDTEGRFLEPPFFAPAPRCVTDNLQHRFAPCWIGPGNRMWKSHLSR